MGSNNINDWQCFLKEAKKSQDVLFIVTAGNNNLNIDNNKIYPASFDLENMIVVSSSTLFGDLAKGSNYGIESVDFLVNGEQIIFYIILFVLIFYTHRENIKRLKNKEESKSKIY